MPRGGYHPPGPGKKQGRPPKAQIPLSADAGIATTVLAMDGPPDHIRNCECRICSQRQTLCTCIEQCGDCDLLEANCECEVYRPIRIKCATCHTIDEHRICHCELCGWWDALLSRDARLRKETRQYLTDRRDGKPAQGVFVGDTREKVRELDFGDLPELVTGTAAGKPN